MLTADTDPSALAGLEIVGLRGERIGRVRQVYPGGEGLGWVGVRGNLFGTEEALLPLDGAVLDDDVLGLPVSRGRFQSAPRRRPDAALGDEEQAELRRFWSAPTAEDDEVAEPTPAADPAEPESTPDPATDDHLTMTASEERLVATTERVPRTRVRLRKVVVTEERTVTVPVRREEYRVVIEPITDGIPVPGASIEAIEQEVVLYEERVIVSTEVVPVERVRLVKEDVVEERSVSATVRRERIDVVDEPEPGTAAQPLAAPAMAMKRSTSSTSPRKPGSTPARSSTAAAADAPPSTGASD